MSMYPPGTGNEYQIAGPDQEWTAFFPCDSCKNMQPFHMFQFHYEIWGECAECGCTLDEDFIDQDFDPDGYEPDCYD